MVPEPPTGIMLLIGMVTLLTGGRTFVSNSTLRETLHKPTHFDIALMGGRPRDVRSSGNLSLNPESFFRKHQKKEAF